MSINYHPSGYLVMDTCSFVHYCNRDHTKHFNYEEIRQYISEKGLWAVITPYTLYECIQNCTSSELIAKEKEELFKAGDFWVINLNRLIGDEYAFEYGPDFLFELGFNFNTPLEFLKRRDIWRQKVYASLAPRLTLLTQIIAIIYVLITERNAEGLPLIETQLKCKYIDEELTNNEGFKSLLDYFIIQPRHLGYSWEKDIIKKDIDAKDKLMDFIEEMVFQFLNLADVNVEQQLTNKYKTLAEYNIKILQNIEEIKMKYKREDMISKWREIKRNVTGEYDINYIIDHFLPQREPIFKEGYKRLVRDWFSDKYKGGGMANTMIDFVNLGVLEVNSKFSLIYITEEKPFMEIIRSSKDGSVKSTNEFYNRFCK